MPQICRNALSNLPLDRNALMLTTIVALNDRSMEALETKTFKAFESGKSTVP